MRLGQAAVTYLALAASSAAGVSRQGNLRLIDRRRLVKGDMPPSCEATLKPQLGDQRQDYASVYPSKGVDEALKLALGYSKTDNSGKVTEAQFQVEENGKPVEKTHFTLAGELDQVASDACLDDYVKPIKNIEMVYELNRYKSTDN